MQDFDQPQIGQVPVQSRRGAFAGFLNGMHGEFHGNPACRADACLDPVH